MWRTGFGGACAVAAGAVTLFLISRRSETRFLGFCHRHPILLSFAIFLIAGTVYEVVDAFTE